MKDIPNRVKASLLPPEGFEFNMGNGQFRVTYRNVGKARFTAEAKGFLQPPVIEPPPKLTIIPGPHDIKLPDRAAILPVNWIELCPDVPMQTWYQRIDGLSVIVTEQRHDGEWYRHASCSFKDRLPVWPDLREVKDLFVGREKKAFQIYPPADQDVNLNPYVHHLWCNLSRDPFPDFRILGMI